jgi:hypothetical protein
MTTKFIKLTSRCGATASFRASTSSGRRWGVSRVTYGLIFGSSYTHIGDAGSLDDAVSVAKAAWERTATKITIT